MSTVLTQRSRAIAATSVVVLTCLIATACGSQLEPGEVNAANGTSRGTVPVDTDGDGVVDPAAPDGSDPLPDGSDPLPQGETPPQGQTPPPGQTPPGDTPPGEAPPDAEPPAGDTPSGDCDGFENQTGITDDTITIANASDISGPVPGLFVSARQATQAYAAYFNATSDICGRKLKVLELDSKADAAADQQAYASACDNAFAAVGSVSSFDQGGARTAQSCGLPDLRSFIVSPDRQACTTCFAAYSIRTDHVGDAIPKYFLQKEAEASKHVGIFYVNVAAAKANAESFKSAFDKSGMNVDLLQGIDTAEFNYVPYVQQMKDNDIQFVMYFGPYQFAIKLQQAMQQQGYTPKVYLEDPTIYDANYVKQSGGAGDGSYVYSPIALFDANLAEMKLYRAYLEQVAPGAVPNYYGLFAWSATRLFVERAAALGGKLTRAALIDSIKKVSGWTGNGVHGPQSVGAKDTAKCYKVFQLNGSSWRQVSPGDYLCGGLIQV